TAAIRWLSITFAILSGILYFLLINLSGDPAVSGHNFFLRIFFAPKGAILVFFTALVFIYLSVFVYENRTSYLS
ncbi:hypothetical protein JW935_26715, partial [candidate division KSB1 bacterium]|nr:hypothetical protein [candidate division KSB1 bacterium]